MHAAVFYEGAPECPLVAIMDFTPAEVASLMREILRLATGEAAAIIIDGEVRLALQGGERDIGIRNTPAPYFICVLRPEAWRQVAGLLEPFVEPDQQGHQWLDETGEVRLLISRSGAW